MKKFSFGIILLFSITFNSCQKQELNLETEATELIAKQSKTSIDTLRGGKIIEIEESPLKKFLLKNDKISNSIRSLSETSAPSTLFDLRGYAINLVAKSSTSGDRYLTSQGTQKEVILAKEDTNNPHQRFSLDFMPLTGYIIIKNVDGKIVSAGQYSSNPDVDILYVKDNTNAMGASWNFLELGPNTPGYILENADLFGYDGPEPTIGNVYNKVIGSQGNKIFFDKYRTLTSQQFDVNVVDDFTLQSIDYINDARATLNQIPDFIVNWSYSNGSSVQQSMTTNFASKASRTSNFSEKSSFGLKVSTSIKAKVPFIASSSIETEINSAYDFTYGKSESLEDSRSYDFPLIVPPNKKVVATAKVSQFKLSVPYIATLKGTSTGNIIKIAGVWEGVDFTEVNVSTVETDLTTGKSKVTQQFKKF